MSSPFMATLLDSMADPQEQTFITLCDLSFSEAMAMLNLVYVGRVKLSCDKLEATKDAAKTFLNIEVEIEKVEPEKVVKPRKRRVELKSPKVNSKRPLLMKKSSAQAPIFVVVPAPPPHWVPPASLAVCDCKRLGGNMSPIPSPQHGAKGFERGRK